MSGHVDNLSAGSGRRIRVSPRLFPDYFTLNSWLYYIIKPKFLPDFYQRRKIKRPAVIPV
jgi:hypothetical protein